MQYDLKFIYICIMQIGRFDKIICINAILRHFNGNILFGNAFIPKAATLTLGAAPHGLSSESQIDGRSANRRR